MFTQVNSAGIRGLECFPVSVEADVSNGLPGFSISGQLAGEVKESQERVRIALKNAGFQLPAKKITVNLSPAGVRKGGTAFDLPIAVAILASFGEISTAGLKDCLFLGELGLDGKVKPISGILAYIEAARRWGIRRCLIPTENCKEGRVITGIEVVGVDSLRELKEALNRREEAVREEPEEVCEEYSVDFRELNGQQVLRRGAEIAAAGMHHLLMWGSAGTGKTMAARRIPTILPPMTWEERLTISRVYSVCGKLPEDRPLVAERPFRSPHHTISTQGLTGGGRDPRPGELSLASGGVLFLDEFPHFGKGAIEALRQPLEEGKITVTRAIGSFEFPADFLLVAALNPCPCGYYPDRNRCRCTQTQIDAYLKRLSRPILERFDLCVEASPVSFRDLENVSGENEDSETIRKRVLRAREIQKQRFSGTKIRYNSKMGQSELRKYCALGDSEREFALKIYESGGSSARGYHKVLKVARTIADLEGEDRIRKAHLAEAFGYRALEGRLWG